MNATATPNRPAIAWVIFRIALFAAAVSLAAYIPYKYATQLHTVTGMYAFLFPLSGVLAVAGIVLALRPRTACDCSPVTRAGVGVLAGAWMVTGVLCVSSLLEMIASSPAGGLFATFHMLAQHVFLSLSILAFALIPQKMAGKLGAPASGGVTSEADQRGKLLPSN